MKTLYISDMDGTLLNSKAELAQESADILNRLIAGGSSFSVATARGAKAVEQMLKTVDMSIPVVLMNGVLVYDIRSGQYLKKEVIPREALTRIIDIIKQTEATVFMYALVDNEVISFYEQMDSQLRQNYVNEQITKHNRVYHQVDFSSISEDVIYFATFNTYEKIKQLHDSLQVINNIHMEMYKDVYMEEMWYLEVFSENGSKYNAVRFLRKEYGFDKIVGFGDNLNDLPFLAACDEFYAVANAKPELKEKATAVIDSNVNNGVAKWLEKHVVAHGC